jgi:hypothetical protein
MAAAVDALSVGSVAANLLASDMQADLYVTRAAARKWSHALNASRPSSANLIDNQTQR